MSDELNDRKIAFLVANEGVEEVELVKPWDAIQNAGGTPELVAPEAGKVQAFNHLDRGQEFQATAETSSASADEYDALVLPGGVSNPDQLRTNPDAVKFVADFVNSGKPIGVICHGAWTLIEADAVRGRTITSWPSLQTDLRNAGADWVDEEVVNDKGLVSSRNPEDLAAFCAKIVEEFAEGKHPVLQPAVPAGTQA